MRVRFHGLMLATLGLCTLCSAAGPAAPAALPGNFFPFYIPWDDVTPNTATDVSFLNHRPAGRFGRVLARDGQFAFAGNGERVRFFATNIAAQAAFPSRKQDADALAASLAKRGVNLVRLHHLDNSWALGQGSIWDTRFPGKQHLDPAMLDRLDYLVSRLIDHGIYVNLNLKVSKELTPADGLPGDALAALGENFPLQKRVDHFDRRMIELQKAYARTLLTHVNPYTKQRYLDEPAVAIVEVNNENSLLELWPSIGLGSDLDRLPAFFKQELTGQWNAWLKQKYADADAMRTAWNAGIEPLGRSVLPATAKWNIEQQGGAVCTIEPGTAVANGLPDLTIRVPTPAAPDWHAQVNVTGVTLENGKTYTLSFEARSDRPRRTRVSATLDQDPWSDCGLGDSIATTPQWQRFTSTFTAHGTVPGHVRVGLAVGDDATPLQLRGVTLRAGSPTVDLPAGESLKAGTVSLPLKGAAGPKRDLIDFLVDTDTNYANEMLAFLRDDLHMKSLACVTQVQWGGLAGYTRERKADLIDTHGYAGHPDFAPGAGWSLTEWTISNTSQVRLLGKTGGSVASDLSFWREAGKPFTVSEFDQPAPTDFAAEYVPMLAAVAAAQDWDAIYTFALADYGAEQPKAGMITGFFDQLNHPGKAAFFPFAAVVLRTGAIPAIEKVATLRLPPRAYQTTPSPAAAWRQALPKVDTLLTRLQVMPEQVGATIDANTTNGNGSGGGGGASPLSMVNATNGSVLRISAPAAAGLVGFVGGATVDAGPLSVTAESLGNQFAAITVHTLDGKPIADSARALVTIVGRAENVGMRWNAERTSVGDGWGQGPVHVEGLRMTVTLARSRPAKVYALDEHGTRKSEVPTTLTDGKLRFAVDPKQATVFYEIAE